MGAKKRQGMKGVSSSMRNGETYWYAQVGGRKQYFGKGDKGLKSATAAKGKDLASKHEARELRGGLEIKRSKFMTFKELHGWYFALPEVQDQKDLVNKIKRLEHLVDFFGNRSLNQFEADQQSHYRAFRKKQGAAEGTVDNEIAMLSAMFHSAVKSKLVPISIMPGEFKRNGEYIPRRTVTDEEYAKLLEKANDEFRDVLVCAFETGMRSAEIIHLKGSQVRLGIQHISGQVLDYISLGIFETKTHAERIIPVSAELKPILERRMQGLGPDDLVFTNGRSKPYTLPQAVAALMKSTCKLAGVKHGDKTVNKSGDRDGIVFHSLRHTRITKWVEAGFSDEIIRRASGHHSLSAYRAYVNIKDALPIMNLVRVAEKMDKSGTKQKKQVPETVVSDRNHNRKLKAIK